MLSVLMKKISTVTVRTGVMLRDFWRAWGPVRAYLACDDLLCFAVGVQKPCWRSMGDITFDACIAMWEEVAYLRRAARKLKLLVDNEKNEQGSYCAQFAQYQTQQAASSSVDDGDGTTRAENL